MGNAVRSARRRKWSLFVPASVFAFVVAEATARVVLARLYSQSPARPSNGADAHLVELLRPAAHADIVYELVPRLDCAFQGVPVQTNSAGFRGPEHPIAKPASGFRVLALGDSVLFGWGVEWEHTGIARLEPRLQAALPGRAVDVIGTGVPGYNTAMQAELLRRRGLQYQPDVVLLDFVANDLDVPNFLLSPTDFTRLDHCFLVDLARRAWRSGWLDPRTPFDWAPSDGRGQFASDPERVPAAYRHLVGVDAFRRALASIQAMGLEHGFRVLVTSHSRLPPVAADACRELGLPTVDVGDRVDSWLREHGQSQYLGSPLTVSAVDPHPSALVHGFWVESVFAKLRELHWLPE